MAAQKRRTGSTRGGRKKKPENIIKLASIINDDSLPAAAPAQKIKMPKPTKLLGKYARDEWKRVTRLLEERGILSPMYMATLQSYCNAFALSCEALDELEKLKRKYVNTTKDGNSDYQSQWMSIYNKADEKAYRLSALFGFSPNDEAKLKAGGAPEAPRKNDFDGM